MKKIVELFENQIDRPIEEVIKVDQANERAVATEIDEYVATESIRDQFTMVFKEIAEAPAHPREGIGIWISGFFGSGKSSFAKILGYTLANRKVGIATAPHCSRRRWPMIESRPWWIQSTPVSRLKLSSSMFPWSVA